MPDNPDGWVTAGSPAAGGSSGVCALSGCRRRRLRDVLRDRGIEQLYTHQAAVVEPRAGRPPRRGHDATASGKTLCYNAPVLSTHPARPVDARRSICFRPRRWRRTSWPSCTSSRTAVAPDELEIGVFTYDGDTPQDARRAIRGARHVVLSNPDMIHSGILPHHPRWAKLFENLRFVVIDELHAYRGVFGSHLTNVLRRLRRMCRTTARIRRSSARRPRSPTPRELAESLVEQPFELVSETGAPRGEKVFLFVNPPVVNQQLGIRRSYLAETRRIAAEFLKRKLQLIVFAQSRLATEILTTYLKDDFAGSPGTRDEIRGYRGGYLPQRRREIEKGCAKAACRAVVSTNALELGIDIGALDVSVMAGYPGPLPPPGSARAAPAGAAAARRRCSWPAARRSISTSCDTRRTSSTPRPSMRSSTQTTCTFSWIT
jgi:DEAD/DEAH box helicase domain-containing protein